MTSEGSADLQYNTRLSLLEARAASGHHLIHPRRSAMPQSRTLYIGVEVHKDSIAVADITKDHGAKVVSLGTIGTRYDDLDTLVRHRPSKAKHLVFV
jgi:hypothetical protein